MSAPITSEDCCSCGACCCNTPENRAEGYLAYIDVTIHDRALLRRRDLTQRYAVADDRGAVRMKLVGPEQRCAALLGAVGRRVRCAIYRLRPQSCRRVQPGSALCLRYRAGLLPQAQVSR